MKRSAGLDAVRVIGIIAIVAGHTWSSNEVFHSFIYPWHVPVFFLLSGYLWKRHGSVRSELRGRFESLLLPYAAWLILIMSGTVLFAVIDGTGPNLESLLRATLGGAFAMRPYSAFWFVTALFVATVALRLLQRWSLWVPSLISVLVLIGATLAPSLADRAPLAFAQGLAYMGLVLVGYGLRRLRPKLTRPVLTSVMALALGAVLVPFVGYVDLKPMHLGVPVLTLLASMLVSCALIVLGERAFQNAPSALADGISTLARAGLVVILLHAAVLQLLDTPPEGRLIDFAVALIVPWLIGLVLLRMPWAWFLVGSKRPRAHRGDGPRTVDGSAIRQPDTTTS